ncbi:response regulator [Halorubellus sp. JP-L1]|uniref:response regulator n=1 Tax=Halorubellus sp. JP-L1 TaxID=2715753 RepID=UPI00140A209F|nr:response regulator [Halorubellus sp. JP-L1]NHN43025.1 response regulator [Halorubellus sp. JP-L1]
MPDTPTTDRPPSPTKAATADEFSAALEDEVRRRLLFHLAHHGASTVDELVDVLRTTTFRAGETRNSDALEAAVYHVHLPKLEGLGIASWRRDADVVALEVDPKRLDAWLAVALADDVTDATGSAPAPHADGRVDVLFVEDFEDLAALVVKRFARDHPDISVTTETDVAAAVEALRDRSFDCIVSDYDMPGMTELDFLRAIRDVDPDVPFILYTGMGSEAVASEALNNGATKYLRKQTDAAGLDVLADRVREVVREN